mmetsp:Transcript_20787/g.33781  ORF Transcript_20787/g.33781 Transcript_20787/m.33781 type:complete len:207 (-) Transcript_20787:262-882(-)
MFQCLPAILLPLPTLLTLALLLLTSTATISTAAQSRTPIVYEIVQLLQLRLALVVLVDVVLLQRHLGVRLVHVHGERVLNALHGQVLSQCLELRAIPIILPIPSIVHLAQLIVRPLEILQMPLQYRLRAHQLLPRRRREPQVLLLQRPTRSLHRHLLIVPLVQLLVRSSDGRLAHVLLDVLRGGFGGGGHRGEDAPLALEAVGAFR